MVAHRQDEDHAAADWAFGDVGNGEKFHVQKDGILCMKIGNAAEARNIGEPTYLGQLLTITVQEIGTGSTTVTFPHPIDAAGATQYTFDSIHDTLTVRSHWKGNTLEWHEVRDSTGAAA